MAKRDKKKIIRVAVIGEEPYFKKMLASLPDFLLLKKRNGSLMIGGSDPDFPNLSKETWEVAYPKPRRMNSFGLPIIVGTGSASSGAEYYKHIWDNEEKLNSVFIPMFGIDPYAFNKEAEGSWYDQAEKSVNEKQAGWVQRYHDWLEKNPPMDYDEPLDSKRIKEIMDKLSKR